MRSQNVRLTGASGPHRPINIAAVLLSLSLLALAGCPAPKLSVQPAAIDFGAESQRQTIILSNTGTGQLGWTLKEVAWQGGEWVEEDISWLTIEFASVVGTLDNGVRHVFLNADRTGLPQGTYSGAGIRVETNGGTAVIPIAMTVPKPTDPGDPGDNTIKLEPTDVLLRGATDTSNITLTNNGSALVHWYAQVVINETGVASETPIQVAVVPADAVTPPGGTTTIAVGVPDPASFDTSHLNYKIIFRKRADDAKLGEVVVTVDVIGPPVVAVTNDTLDFGTTNYQMSFLVYNNGDVNSLLDFAVFSKDNDSYTPFDVQADPLVAAIYMPKGSTGLQRDPDDTLVYAREVSVTIARDAIEKDRETRDLWIGAVRGTDSSGNPIIDPGIPPQKVTLVVSAASYVEGALNRSRPPSLMRFVFTLRDKRGIATNAADPFIRSRINFSIQEDKFPLDPDESSFFVTGPENLKYNIVLMLDYTGSMFMAGVNHPTAKLKPGEAIAQMEEAARQFILDLPATYRVALMEHHDRLQPGRVIHTFDTDKAALLAALNSFSVPVAEHGSSDLHDALYDASQRLTQEDSASTLPFDEADVRSVIFVTDGWDTSSTKKLEEVTKYAKDNRVRLYPIGFSGNWSNPVNSGALIKLASDTGGHAHYSPEVKDMAKLLDTSAGLSFAKTSYAGATNTATVYLRNLTSAPLSWTVANVPGWITVAPQSGAVPPLTHDAEGNVVNPGLQEMTVALHAGLSVGEYDGAFSVLTGSGNATVGVHAVVDAAGVLEYVVTPQTTDAGQLWHEMRGQVVLTYTSLFQEGKHTYYIEATFPDSKGDLTSAFFEEDAMYWSGDPRAGQISLITSGMQGGKAEVYIRADYVPRNITQFRFRFVPGVPVQFNPGLTLPQRTALAAQLGTIIDNDGVSVVADGLLAGWRLINEGHGVFLVVTEPGNYLRYASFGNLLKASLEGLPPGIVFSIGFRVDNSLYYKPAVGGNPSYSKWFMYPGGFTNPAALLLLGNGSSIATPAAALTDFVIGFDPDAPGAWDRDGDGWPDFDDINPDDPNVGGFPQ